MKNPVNNIPLPSLKINLNNPHEESPIKFKMNDKVKLHPQEFTLHILTCRILGLTALNSLLQYVN